MTPPRPPTRQAPGSGHPNGAGPDRPAPSSFGGGRLAARADELVATARVEGRALRAEFSDPRSRAWVWAEIADWERRVTHLLQTVLESECQGLWRRTVLDDADELPADYLPGSQTWWAEYRLTRRLSELDRILELLDGRSDSEAIEASPVGAADPMDGGVDGSSTQSASESAA